MEKLDEEEIKRRAETFENLRERLILPAKPCPRCTPIGQKHGRGQVFVHVDNLWVKCSKCGGKGLWIEGRDP